MSIFETCKNNCCVAMPPKTKIIRHRGLQCPFNSSQYISIFLHILTTLSFVAFATTTTSTSSLFVSILIFSTLTICIVSAWLFTSWVDSSLTPNRCERCFCGTLYCFKRAQLKTRYCAVSKKKVPEMDHYCVWMNTAIGSRNYTSFFLVALFSTLLLWFQMVISIFGFTNSNATTITLISSVVQFICAAGLAAPYTTLLFFHLHLIAKQISTFDYLMQQAKVRAAKRKAMKAEKTTNTETSPTTVEIKKSKIVTVDNEKSTTSTSTYET